MKKIILLCCLLAVFVSSTPVSAAAKISVSSKQIYLDGKKLDFPNLIMVQNDAVLVPFRDLFEALGAEVRYDGKKKTITSTRDGITIHLTIGHPIAFRNGNAIQLRVAPTVINNVTYVPIRFVGQSFDYSIQLDTSRIYLYSPSKKTATTVTPNEQLVQPKIPSGGITTDLTTEEIGEQSNRVVYIEALDSYGKAVSRGSGVIVGANGEILTNYHVIEGASSARIFFGISDSVMTSNVIIYDKDRDLALLKVEKIGLPAVTIGDSSKLKLGQAVVAIGSPLGFTNTLSSGLVSTTNRVLEGQNYIQVTTPIDHGSSGGALFNMRGELVGITTAFVQSSANINLAIPSVDVVSFLQRSRWPQQMSSLNPVLNSGSVASPATTWMTTEQLQEYLNNDFSTMTFKDLTLNFDWIVISSPNGVGYSIGGILRNSGQFSSWLQYQIEDDTAFSGMVYYILNKLATDLQIEDTFMSLFYNGYFSFYPTSFPVDSITPEGQGYRVNFNFVYGSIEEQKGLFFYNNSPDNPNALRSIPLR